ncbi:MAG: hypothetical protein ABEI75_02940 [Halobaculum sp.]
MAPTKLLSFVAGVAATAWTLASLEEGDRRVAYGPVEMDAYVGGLCAGVFLAVYGLSATVFGLLFGD